MTELKPDNNFLSPAARLTSAAEIVFTALGHAAAAWARIEKHIDILLIQINKTGHSSEKLDLHDPAHPWRFDDKLDLLKLYFNKHPALASHTYEVSAMPCTGSETDRSPSEGVAETLLHETAGRGPAMGIWRRPSPRSFSTAMAEIGGPDRKRR